MPVQRLLGILTLMVLLGIGVWFVSTDHTTSAPSSAPETAALAPQRGMAPARQDGSDTARQADRGPTASEPVAPTMSQPVHSLPVVSGSTATLNREINPRQNPETFLAGPVTLPDGERDPLADFGVNGGTAPTPTLVFEGIS